MQFCILGRVIDFLLFTALSMAQFEGTATEASGEITVTKGDDIRSTKTYKHPITVEAEIKSVGPSECIAITLFTQNSDENSRKDRIKMVLGSDRTKWAFYPGQKMGDNGSVTEYRKVKFVVNAAGKVFYYIDDKLVYTSTPSMLSGQLRFVPHCTSMKVRNIRVIEGNMP